MFKKIEDMYYLLSDNLLIIKLLCILHPVLSYLGIGWEKPVIISVPDEGTLKNVITVLRGYGIPVVKSLSVSPKEVKETLRSAAYNLVIFRYRKNRYTKENLEIICEDMEEIDGVGTFPTLSVIMTIGPVPKDILEYGAGCIFMRNGTGAIAPDYSEEWVRPFIEYIMNIDFSGISKKVYDMASSSSYEYAVLLLITKIWEGFLGRYGVEAREILSQSVAMNQAVTAISREWSGHGNGEIYLDVFRNALFEYVEMHVHEACVPCKLVPEDKCNKIEQIVFYDSDSYYISSKMLDKIIKNLEKKMDGLDIKGELSKVGALHVEGQGRSYYTTKVEMLTTSSEIIEPRLVKLKRSKIDIDGEMTLLEVLMAKGEV